MTFTLAILLVLLVLFYTFQSLFTRMFSMNYAGEDASQSTSVFAICFGGFIGLATLFVRGLPFEPAWQTVLWGIANAFMLWLYNVSLIESGNRGSYAFLMICSMFGAIVVPLFVDVVFMGETLTLVQAVAIVMMLTSFVVMNLRGLSLKGASGAYYMWCGLLFMANGLYATIMNLQEGMMGSAQSSEMIVITYCGTALIVTLFHLLRGQAKQLFDGFRMGKKAALFALGSCVVATLASNMLMYLLGLMNASVLYTIDNGGVLVMSAICSCLFFKEKLHLNQIIGIVLATVSIVMISL